MSFTWIAAAALLGVAACPARNGARPVAPPADAALAARPIPDTAALLAEIGRRFGQGLSATSLAKLAGAEGAIAQGPAWAIDVPRLRVKLVVVAPSDTAASSWVRVHPEPTQALRLGDLEPLFGGHRKQPPGEYTWVLFEGFRASEVRVSAQVVLAGDEGASAVSLVQFQKP